MRPIIKVETDFDGFFEAYVNKLLLAKTTPFKHKVIVINAGPYRSYAVNYKIVGDTIYLDFYSALRKGLGKMTDEEERALAELL